MTTTHWRCRADWLIPPQTCNAGGTFTAAAGGATGPAHRHTQTTKHPTETSLHPFADRPVQEAS